MADSPNKQTSGVIDISIKSNGNEISSLGLVRSIDVCQRVNKICKATIIIEDGDMPTNSFPISQSDDFKPGAEISILAAYNNLEKDELFKGVVIKHGLQLDQDGQTLVIECTDMAVATTVGRKNANFSEQTNSDIISSILGNYSKINVAEIDSTQTSFQDLVQFNATDWDFIVTRAQASGLVVLNYANELRVVAPSMNNVVLDVQFGEDIIEFDGTINALNIFSAVDAVSWDPETQTSLNTSASAKTVTAKTDLDADTLAEVIGLDTFQLQSNTMLTQDALTEWANAQQIISALSKTQGLVKFKGKANINIGDAINIQGINDRFNDAVFVSGVQHKLASGDWETTVDFGLEAEWFSGQNSIQSAPAAGLLPGVEGLMTGKVLQLEDDPLNQSRIKVSVPVLQNEPQGIWARVMQYYASSGFGNFFIPEVDDEVVLGYFNNDPSNPVVLGSVYSSKNAPPYEVEAENNIKALVTRCGHKVEFDDDKKIVTIATPSGNTMIFDDDDKSISITDQNSNSMKFSSSGIDIDSPKDITISAKGKITIDAMDNISATSKADVSVSGLNINNEANIGFTAKGNATAELSASGQTTVKGAMVMIN